MRTLPLLAILVTATPLAHAETGRFGAFATAGAYVQSDAAWQAGAGLSVSFVLARAGETELVIEGSLGRSYLRIDNPRDQAFGASATTLLPTLQLHVPVSPRLTLYPLVGAGLWTSTASQDCSVPPDGAADVCDAYPLWDKNHLVGRAGVGARYRIGRYDLVIEPEVDYVFGRMPTGNPVAISIRTGVLATF